MATEWVLGKISDALQPSIQSGVSTAGAYAGSVFNTMGSGINGIGESINGTIKRYGDGFKDYGNGVMDWTNATGPRAQTASNPLGLGTSKTHGKRAVTSPSMYSAPPKPKQNPSKTLMTTGKPAEKKIGSAPAMKALPAPAAKSAPAAQPKKAVGAPAQPKKAVGVPAQPKAVLDGANPGAFKKTTAAAKPVTAGNQGAMKKPAGSNVPSKTPRSVKASTATATQGRPAIKPDYVAAANPLGLS